MEYLSKRLKELRNSKGLKAEELAEILGVSRRVIFMYEKNETKPSLEVLVKISDYFNVPIDYLVGREERNRIFHGLTPKP